MRLQCVTCNGVYDDLQTDTTRYYHVCPPLSVAELRRAVQLGKVALQGRETVEEAHGRRVYQRTLARDERPVRRTADGLPPQIVAEGRGTRPAPPADDDPTVIIVPD